MRSSADEGAILLLVLAFLLLFGLFISALLAQTSSSFRTTDVVRDRAAKTYNADAGVDFGIMRIRQDQTLCPNVAAGERSITTELSGGLNVNPDSQSVTVTCRTIEGSAIGANGYAAMLLSPDADALETGNGNGKVIEGPVFVKGGFKLNKPLKVVEGDVEKGSTGCTAPANLIVTAPYSFTCPVTTPSLPAHDLPSYPTTSRGKTGASVAGGCTVFRPGIYTQAPDLGAKNYFTSGVYVFRDISLWAVGRADVYGGEQATGENLSITSGAPCTTDSGAGATPNGTGVQFIFEGNSRVELENQSRIELFNRTPQGAAEGTPGISVYAVGSDAPAPWKPYNSSQPVIGLKNGTTPEAAFHGLIYAPTAKVQLFATNSTVAQSLAGIVADKLLLESSASANALSIAGTKGKGKRVVIITATAPGNDVGEAAITSTAVLEIANDAAKSFRVVSRRVE